MKLVKNTLAIAISSIIALPTFAANVTLPNIDIYGRADVSIQKSDEGAGGFTEVKSNASRIGFKGQEKLNDDLDVVYKAEFEVDIDGDGETFKKRNQYIGLKGGFGEVLLGHNDTMLKQSQGKVDLFSDLNGDIKSLWKGENRLKNTLSYKSPKFSDFQLGVTYIADSSNAEEDENSESAYSMAVFYGDKKLKKSTVYASIAMDSEVKGYDTTRATIQGKVSGITLGAIYHTQEKVDGSAEMDGFLVSAKYKMDKVTVKGQYQTADYDGGDSKSGVTVGADYSLAKSTKLYAFYTSFDMDSGADEDYLAAGIQYKF